MSEDVWLERIATTTDTRRERAQDFEAADSEWRESIRLAAKAGVSVTRIAGVAGVSRERVYQIKAGRR